MKRMTYEQAFEDHQYLWREYAHAQDISGGYVDQGDLDKLLANPTKTTARECLESQIIYWFEIGPDLPDHEERWKTDPIVRETCERHGASDALLEPEE